MPLPIGSTGRYGPVTAMELRLETGRTHQIRVHLSEAGFPLLGDPVYGGSGRLTALKDQTLKDLIRKLGRQALHARTLGFLHPASGEYLEFSSPYQEDMAKILEHLNKSVLSDEFLSVELKAKTKEDKISFWFLVASLARKMIEIRR